MDLESLKEVLGEKFEPLKVYVDDLIGQRDAARHESIDGRKKLKKQVEDLTAAQARVLERLGIDSIDDLEKIGDAKGQADAVKQFDAKVKRLERDLADAKTSHSEMVSKYRSAVLDARLQKAVASHPWLDTDVAVMLARSAVKFEDDEPFYVHDGKQMPIEDGIKVLATTKPHLLKATGAGGSGYQAGAGSAGRKTLSRTDFEALNPADRMAAIKSGVSIT